jgi:hypothetical protein
MSENTKTKVQKCKEWCENHPVISILIIIVSIITVICGLLISLNQGDDAFRSLKGKYLTNNKETEQILGGIVQDENGKCLTGVSVILPEYNLNDTTDWMGKYLFKLQAYKQIKVTLIATKVGYLTYKANPTLGNNNNNFILEKNKR